MRKGRNEGVKHSCMYDELRMLKKYQEQCGTHLFFVSLQSRIE